VSETSSPYSVLVCDGLAEVGLARLRQSAEVILDDRSALGRVDAWIVRGASRVDAAALESATPRLRVVGRAGVGVDNIDLEAARRLGVVVLNAPEATTIAVAELTLGLMIALARHIPAGDAALRAANGRRRRSLEASWPGRRSAWWGSAGSGAPSPFARPPLG
jgi:D-3-phosphoglycerate dehydrogenase